MNALAELFTWELVPSAALEVLSQLDRSILARDQIEHFDYLMGRGDHQTGDPWSILELNR